MAAQRKRGYYLSDSGWERLWEAIHAEFPEGHGRTSKGDEDERYNLAKIEALTQTGTGGSVSDETISKIIYRTERTDKSKIQSLFRAFELHLQASDLTQDAPIAEPIQKDDPNFVGRENAITDLNKRVTQGAKIILIQGAGGVGKTTLATKYLIDRFKEKVIYFPIGKETENISPIEGLLEANLRILGEEPARDFWASLLQLQYKLQGEAIGVLVDNLEPALDKDRRFIEPHRRYLELLRILADPSVKSITLITSREALAEEVDISPYPLPVLDDTAWQSYFNNRAKISNNQAILPLYEAYKGNAMAMKLLCDCIVQDHAGDVARFWQEHQKLGKLKTIENLVEKQFERLETIHPEAYRLLCRMGCFRYQDVRTVPLEGLFCLLWDVEEDKRGQMIRSLRDRSLVDVIDGEYQLNPLIREEAINRLRNSEDWEKVNRQAAEFWTESVKEVKTVEDALRAFEAYYHFLYIEDFEKCAEVVTYYRRNDLSDTRGERLGVSFYRLSLFEFIETAINTIKKQIYSLISKVILYNILGDIKWMRGNLNNAIELHCLSKKLVESGLQNSSQIEFDQKMELKRYQLWAAINRGLCNLDKRELDLASKDFLEAKDFIEHQEDLSNYIKEKHGVESCSTECKIFITLIDSLNDDNELIIQTMLNEIILVFDRQFEYMISWSKGYTLVFLGVIYKNIQKYSESFQRYKMSIKYAEESNYRQVKAKALTGLGELYRIKEDYDAAFDHHFPSIKILDKIGAKCDLAEAYFQLALTYQAIGDQSNSKTYFDNAL